MPTILGLLSIGKTPQDFIQGAYVQFLRIDGTELADPVIDEENIGGAFVELLRRTEEKHKAHNRSSIDITSRPTHEISRPYPMPAIRQLLYNAVLHRTYERTNAPIRVYWFNDRIEITSPGGPFGNVTPDDFGQPGITDYRNPNIADVLKTFGYIQAFGRGIATARRELQKNGNPKLEFDVNQSAVQCVIRRKR
jgi:ATP-dependent DNA helicase RecG